MHLYPSSDIIASNLKLDPVSSHRASDGDVDIRFFCHDIDLRSSFCDSICLKLAGSGAAPVCLYSTVVVPIEPGKQGLELLALLV
jgi:hypothetical protein